MKPSNFDTKYFAACKRIFKYPETEYSLNIVKTKSSSYLLSVTHRNDIVAVEVSYEPFEQYIFVRFIELINGSIPDYPIFVRTDAPLYSYYLEDIIELFGIDASSTTSQLPDRAPIIVIENHLKKWLLLFKNVLIIF